MAGRIGELSPPSLSPLRSPESAVLAGLSGRWLHRVLAPTCRGRCCAPGLALDPRSSAGTPCRPFDGGRTGDRQRARELRPALPRTMVNEEGYLSRPMRKAPLPELALFGMTIAWGLSFVVIPWALADAGYLTLTALRLAV